MKIIDNVSELLGDDFKAEITPGAKVRVAASTFSIFAFEALRKELEQVSELEFIFTSPSFVTTKVTDKLRKERREFFIPSASSPESSLYGSEFEVRLRNKLTQRAIAKECADWVRRKVTFRSNSTGNPMQQFAVVGDQAAYMPLQGFTTADLGYERGNAVSNMVHRIDEVSMTAQYIQIFDQIWNNPAQLVDVTDAVYEHIASVYAENSPARIYFLILYNLFSEFLDDISDDVLPNDRTGYQGTQIWQSLYNFQRDAATGIINKLETYNGCILADSVGLGKTFTALAVIKYYELRFEYVLDGTEGIVMDFFAGSGSTAEAVFELGARTGQNCPVILVQFPESLEENLATATGGTKSTIANAINYLQKLGKPTLISELSKLRLHAAGKRVAAGKVHTDWSCDIGFRLLKVDTTNLTDVLRTPDETDQQALSGLEGSVKSDRSAEDLLFQVLLDWGLELTMPISVEKIEGHEVLVVEGDVLIACFDAEVSPELVRAIAKRQPLRAVFRDSGFASDAARINADQIFREVSPATDVKAI